MFKKDIRRILAEREKMGWQTRSVESHMALVVFIQNLGLDQLVDPEIDDAL